jgi:hypothetical protein
MWEERADHGCLKPDGYRSRVRVNTTVKTVSRMASYSLHNGIPLARVHSAIWDVASSRQMRGKPGTILHTCTLAGPYSIVITNQASSIGLKSYTHSALANNLLMDIDMGVYAFCNQSSFCLVSWMNAISCIQYLFMQEMNNEVLEFFRKLVKSFFLPKTVYSCMCCVLLCMCVVCPLCMSYEA